MFPITIDLNCGFIRLYQQLINIKQFKHDLNISGYDVFKPLFPMFPSETLQQRSAMWFNITQC